MLRGQLACTFADRDIVRLTGCSRASAFRAFRELTTFGLVERVAGGYAFVPDAAQTLACICRAFAIRLCGKCLSKPYWLKTKVIDKPVCRTHTGLSMNCKLYLAINESPVY